MISVIQNTYERNEYVRESAALTVKALKESGLDYQYIIFNDNGDPLIKDDVESVLSDKVEYIYSDYNFGMGVCSGGWIGALPYVKGDYIHNTGQDDVFTPQFYRTLVQELENNQIYLAYSNGFAVNNDLTSRNGSVMGPLNPIDYSNPKSVFNSWFQRVGNELRAANNYIPAPGVLYKKSLHEKIGLPSLEEFKGSADFEYWARVLFNGMGVSYVSQPTWLYRISKYSVGSKESTNTNYLNNTIRQKYQKLLENE